MPNKTTKTSSEPKTKRSPRPKAKRRATSRPDRIVDQYPETPAPESGLDLSESKHLFGKILFGAVILALVIFFVKTGIWEYYYYSGKEGTPRSPATVVEETEELDETEVTAEQRAEYTVPADHPRYLSIDKLGIKNARVLNMGLKNNGELNTPGNIFDVGWYNASGTPGSGRTLLIDGHNGGPNIEGVFKHINQLFEGDLITVERGDGEIFTYKVVENKEIPLAESDNYMKTALVSAVPGVEGLTLISCIGEWSQSRQTYLSRQFVRAVRVEN